MSYLLKEKVGFIGIALVNGLFVYPKLKQMHRDFYSIPLHPEDPTHFVSLEV